LEIYRGNLPVAEVDKGCQQTDGALRIAEEVHYTLGWSSGRILHRIDPVEERYIDFGAGSRLDYCRNTRDLTLWLFAVPLPCQETLC